ncbi:MAG TPA: PTS sugar transporter subunit IIA [Spirochaetota bacterium]|nr:PTS sugar transporter subunit IIA [Spirochaetota bacterium]HOM38722.1 PTS sugar transporter subunit IIA [Spirochaetota bacterium]HPQ49519.1 PTS sugar transporter subunit IIA [Spirochaetota bacterium]
MIHLKDYLDENNIIFIDEETKEDVLEKMIDFLKSKPFVKDFKAFKKALFEREKIVSTGIGFGIAIPHVKIKEITNFFICIGVHKKGIDWESIDKKPVKLVFLIGGPDDHITYLKLLAKINLILRNPETREKLENSKTSKEIFDILSAY